MSVIHALSEMHREAVEQIRAGDHNAFLVGFLTTSTMLELASLTSADLRLDEYVTAAAETITQYAPIDRVRLRLEPDDLPPIVASVGIRTAADRLDDTDADDLPFSARFEAEGVGSVVVSTVDLAAPLQEGGFLAIAAEHIGKGLQQVMEAERRRRRAAVADTLALIASLNEQWGQPELEALAGALAMLPGAHAAHIGVGANRLAGVLDATVGLLVGELVERSFTIDERVQADVVIAYRDDPTGEHTNVLDEILATLAANLSRIEQNIRLTSEAETDQLTGVANRRRVGKSLAAARAMADRRNEPFAVLLFDLDHFKSVNDTFGHAVGDELLVQVGARLRLAVRPDDVVARMGGDEFAVVTTIEGDPATVHVLAERVEQVLSDPYEVDGHQLRVGASVGWATAPVGTVDADALLEEADRSLYRVKLERRGPRVPER